MVFSGYYPHINIFGHHSSMFLLKKQMMYGPHPTVWAVFLFGYAILGLALFFTTIIGLVKYSLHIESQILWLLPFLLGGLVILYFVAQTGQKMGVEQTFQLHHFFEESIGQSVHIT
jgi:hypothetical protein